MRAGPIDGHLPLLRSPPLLGAAAAVSARAAQGAVPDEATIDRVFAAIRDAQVGGRFWAPAMPATNAALLVRVRSAGEIAPLRTQMSEIESAVALWLLPPGETVPAQMRDKGVVHVGEVEPWSLMNDGARLIAHGDDEWVALAHIAGLPVRILSPGRFGEPGADDARLRVLVANALWRAHYHDPFFGHDSDIDSTIALLAGWRRIFEGNRGIVAACGIAWWKRREIALFLRTPEHPLRFFRSEARAIAHTARHGGAIAVWPSRISAGMPHAARAQHVPLVRIEDGFVRSVGLGANLVPPSSISVDRLGIHYDPGRPSDLEGLFADTAFSPVLLARAARLRETILSAGISKYGGDAAAIFPERRPGRRLVLVPGQVEDDMSVRLGGGGLASNLELLRRTRAIEPDAEIWFRPHPDVDAGHRKGAIRDGDALRHADRVVRGGGMAALLDRVDGVHVLTSLTGFEALLRGRDVTCHGIPFYAGWGLTRDLATVPDRRGRALTLDQLVATVLILYPRYLDPVTHLPCPPEVLIRRMTDGTAHNRLGWVTRLRKIQGRLTKGRSS